jgi:hypothetical protein
MCVHAIKVKLNGCYLTEVSLSSVFACVKYDLSNVYRQYAKLYIILRVDQQHFMILFLASQIVSTEQKFLGFMFSHDFFSLDISRTIRIFSLSSGFIQESRQASFFCFSIKRFTCEAIYFLFISLEISVLFQQTSNMASADWINKDHIIIGKTLTDNDVSHLATISGFTLQQVRDWHARFLVSTPNQIVSFAVYVF